MALATEYAWYPGHNIALATLVAVQTVADFTYGGLGVQIVSDPVNAYPLRTRLESGRERMDGRIDHTWRVARGVTIAAVDYVIDTYFSTPTGLDAAITINTRRHDRGTWARYNAYLAYPIPGQDYRLEAGYVFDWVIRFHTLTPAT